MSTRNSKEDVRDSKEEARKANGITVNVKDLGPEIIMNSWLAEGGIELAAERFTALRALFDAAVAAERKKIKDAEEEIRAKSAAMEAKFAGLGGVPPLDEAEQARARARGVRGVKPTPPSDDGVFRAALVQRILVAHLDEPNAGGPSTRGLARWSGAAGERIVELLKAAPEVARTGDDRWVPAKAPAEQPTA